MTSIQKAQLEFLNETASFYNLGNRCTVNDMPESACKYYVPGKSGCAIGRKITTELAQELDCLDSSGVQSDYVFDKLPNTLKELGQVFLSDMQFLHDQETNWTNTGLSENGKNMVKLIKEKYSLE